MLIFNKNIKVSLTIYCMISTFESKKFILANISTDSNKVKFFKNKNTT